MHLDDQVVSLDLAKRLKELGVPQDSLFCHYGPEIIYMPDMSACCPLYPFISAFTVTEIFNLLPMLIDEGLPALIKTADLFDGLGYQCCYQELKYFSRDKKIPDALAKMLIHLIKNDLVKIEKLK